MLCRGLEVRSCHVSGRYRRTCKAVRQRVGQDRLVNTSYPVCRPSKTAVWEFCKLLSYNVLQLSIRT